MGKKYLTPCTEVIELTARQGILSGSQTETDGSLSPMDGVLGDFDWTGVTL